LISIVAGLPAVVTAFGRALVSQLHPRMLLLTIVPFVLSLLLIAAVLWFGLKPLNDWIGEISNHLYSLPFVEAFFGWFGTGAIKAAIMSMLAMWLLLPIMILVALVFVGTLAVPTITKHVAQKQYPDLIKKYGGSFRGTIWISVTSCLIALLLWVVTLPLSFLPPFTFLLHPVLWGWLTYRVMAYDCLAGHADLEERKRLMHDHRWPLLTIGAIAGALGTLPTFLWIGGALSIVILPLLAAGAIWLYVAIFVFSGLWFQYYCLEALAQQRLFTIGSHTIHPADKS